MPQGLLRDALALLMGQHLPSSDTQQICGLPTYVKTALVFVLRRYGV
jgi:hypothetical protein